MDTRQDLHDRINAMGPRELERLHKSLAMGGADRAEPARDAPAWPNNKAQDFSGESRGATAGCEVLADHSRPSHERIGLGNIEDVMAYQPWGPLETDRGTQVREALTHAAKVILRCVPEGRYRDKAVDGILQVRMDANAGISFRGRF